MRQSEPRVRGPLDFDVVIQKMKLNDLLENVHDESSFLKFSEALQCDRVKDISERTTAPVDECGRGPAGWENHTIEEFLEAAQSWAGSH